MDKDPLVTIGIPAFNASRYIADCLRSVTNQSFDDFEVIVTDDGSTDNTCEIVNSFSDRRIRLVRDNINLGIAARINQQVDMARGRFFCRMDADDIMFVSRLEKQVGFMQENPETDVMGSQAIVIDERNRIMGKRYCNPSFSRHSVLREILFIHPTVLGKTSWFRENRYSGDFNGVEDFYLWNTTLGKSRFRIVTEPLLFYRDATTDSRSKYLFRQRQIRQVFGRLTDSKLITRQEMCLLQTRSLLKSVAFSSLSIFGLHSFLISRRNNPMEPEEKNRYTYEMNSSMS